ncbi:MAG: OmpA family protein [Kiritimatiellae bacterium]|nr:OmpA family protein [Kiritimatiellia bacterium]
MKFNMLMAVAAVAVAVTATGCRYDKSGKGAAGDDAQNLASDVTTVDPEFSDSDAESGSIDSLQGGKSFEELYQRCTDVNFAPVYFGLDSTVLSEGELGKVEAVASHLASNPNRVVAVDGHCDERGSNEYNMSLGESRAVIIRNYLVESGISADRIQTRSYGEERPAVEGTGESVWSRNRRAEFAIFQK